MSDELLTTRSVTLLSSSAVQLLADWELYIAFGEMRPLSNEELRQGLVQQADLARLLTVYQGELDTINPALFPYLSSEQKKMLRQKLVRAHYLHSLQAEINQTQLRLDGLASNRAHCQQYERLLSGLNRIAGSDEHAHSEDDLRRYSDESEKPLAWSGMRILAPLFGLNMLALCEGTLGKTKNLLLSLDKKPLYLGWSRQLILCTMDSLSNHMQRMPIEQQAFSYLGEGMSYVSFFVVQTLFALEIFLVMKNTLAGAWVNQKNALQIPTLDLFLLQIKARKFYLLDIFAASAASIVGFMSLIQAFSVWPWTSLVSLGYRLCELGILAFQFDAERIAHESNLRDLAQELEQLIARQEQASESTELARLAHDHRDLSQSYARAAVDWRFKKIEYRNRIMAILGLLVGFTVFTCFLFPPALIPAATAITIALVGAVVCVCVALVVTYLKAQLVIERGRYEKLCAREQLQVALAQFKNYQLESASSDVVPQMKALYLEIKQLSSRADYQRRLVAHQQVMLALQLFTDSLFPPAVVLALLFLPTGISLGVILMVLLVNTLALNLTRANGPQEEKQPLFDEEEFNAFCAKPELASLSQPDYKKEYLRFFQSDSKLDDDNEFMVGENTPP